MTKLAIKRPTFHTIIFSTTFADYSPNLFQVMRHITVASNIATLLCCYLTFVSSDIISYHQILLSVCFRRAIITLLKHLTSLNPAQSRRPVSAPGIGARQLGNLFGLVGQTLWAWIRENINSPRAPPSSVEG